MNVVFLTQAVNHVQEAVKATFDPKERAEIQAVEESLLRILRNHGVFIGTAEKLSSTNQDGMSLPRATQDESRRGWTVRYVVLDEITDAVNEKSEDGICLEHTEAVILELAKRGHVTISKA